MYEIAKNHQVDLNWRTVLEQVALEMRHRGAHPGRTVVLLPYAQLMPLARQAWLELTNAQGLTSVFVPRFETTLNWGRSLGGSVGSADELRLDAARDLLTAQTLLRRAGLGGHQAVLAPRVMETAWGLARLACAVPPDRRPAWGQALGKVLAAEPAIPELALESASARIALAWASNSAYPTDPVFDALPDLLVVIRGFQDDALSDALVRQWGDRSLMLSLAVPCAGGAPRLHAARDAEDEAMRAAACVLAHLAAGRAPVALVAQDRVLTRRVRALLDGQGVVMRDETGWKLSTTRAAASVMGLLRANTGAPTADVVLDWLKHSPAFDAGEVAALEAALRRRGGSHWRVALGAPALESLAQEIREVMQASRTLSQWLAALASVLERAGQWSGLMADRAGQAVVQALRLSKDAWQEFSDLEARMSPASFIAWVDQTLEAASYLPDHPRQAEVIILPLSQLLGRPLGAVVLPGCDELRLPVSPEPGGAWTPAQTQLLGLPLREGLTRAMRSAWDYALGYDQVDLLWRQSDAGDSVMASGFVLELLLKGAGVMADDPCLMRDLAQRSAAPPAPGAAALAPQRLSSTAYEDLRRCPYRFFALRQLALQEDEELESEVDKRDFGNWLHATLRYFHEALIQRPDADLTERRRMIDSAADRVTSEQDLPADEFLPFAAAWPNLREGYLKWLTAHESTGAKFIQAEVGKTLPLGPVMLVGQLDRLDRLADGSPMVMDYKTESRQVTQARISQGSEDTQIAFYAALMQEDTVQGSLSGAYISVTEREGTKTLTPPDIQGLRELLLRGLAQDMEGIAQGRPLPALGHGEACDYCAARGLCRRDFWEQSALGPLPSADGTASEGLQHV